MPRRTRSGTAAPPARARRASGEASRRVRTQYARFLAVGARHALVDPGMLHILLVQYPTRAALSLLADNSFAVTRAILSPSRTGDLAPYW